MNSKHNNENKEAQIAYLQKQIQLFPRFEGHKLQNLPDIIKYIKGKFPWGCDELQSDYVCSKQDIGFCWFYTDDRNIGISLKYGIMSGLRETMLFIHEKWKKQGNFFIFLGCRSYLYAVAKIIQYQPDSSFKYWSQVKRYQKIDQSSEKFRQYIIHDPYGQLQKVRFAGVFKVKFLKLGYFKIQQKIQPYKILSPQEIQHIIKQFQQNSTSLLPQQLISIFKSADKCQEIIRKKEIQLLKENAIGKTIHSYETAFRILNLKQKNYIQKQQK